MPFHLIQVKRRTNEIQNPDDSISCYKEKIEAKQLHIEVVSLPKILLIH